MTVKGLLDENSDPTSQEIREYLAGTLCRCGSYVKIEEAVLDAAERARGVVDVDTGKAKFDGHEKDDGDDR
jgi:xanthine dehydrogenase iron-sulfur cluster and FAD-binding subunit A